MLTLLVDDLDAQVAALTARGLTPDATETLPDAGRTVAYLDPEVNTVTFGLPGSAAAGSRVLQTHGPVARQPVMPHPSSVRRNTRGWTRYRTFAGCEMGTRHNRELS